MTRRYFPPGLRLAARVKRWSTVETLRQNSIAEHMFFVAHYARDVALLIERPDLVPWAMTYALYHDRKETVTGDMPGPVKRSLGALDNTLVNSEDFARFGDDPDGMDTIDAPLVKAIVKVADVTDQLMEAAVELSLGNHAWGHGMWLSACKQATPALEGLHVPPGMWIKVWAAITESANNLRVNPTIVGVYPRA